MADLAAKEGPLPGMTSLVDERGGVVMDEAAFRTLGVAVEHRRDGVTLDALLGGVMDQVKANRSADVVDAVVAARAFADGDDSGYDPETRTVRFGSFTVGVPPGGRELVRALTRHAVAVFDQDG